MKATPLKQERTGKGSRLAAFNENEWFNIVWQFKYIGYYVTI